MERRLRFRDLREKGIVKNRQTLKNWIKYRGFPPGQMTGPNTRTWSEGEIETYVNSRPAAPKPAYPTKRPRGRPRKITASTVEANT
jgi:predicted DNA-binding transcriptional regulator AlpA